MLVLTRKVGERICIDSSIRITVVRVAGDQVRIGIEAPDDVRILREEVLERLVQTDETARPRSAVRSSDRIARLKPSC